MDSPNPKPIDEAPPRWAPLLGVTAALSVFGAAQGLSYPLFTLVMQRQGYPAGLIGVSAAMLPLGLTLSSALVPALVQTFGARRLGVGCAILGAALFLVIGLLQNPLAWYPLRFLLGFAVNPLFVLGEVWALALAPPSKRGRVMGLFNTLTGMGYAVGPLTMIIVGTQGLAPFMVAVCGFAGCGLVLAGVARALPGFEPSDGDSTGGFLWFARLAPALLVAVLVSAASQQSTYSLLPVFGASYGVPAATLAALVTALSAGNVLLQIPLGLAAERVGGRAMMLACAGATGLGMMALPWLVLTPLVWPLLCLLGGVGYGIYTMALVELGNRFEGAALVTGNASFALMWGIGGIVGPPSAGSLMQAIGPSGLPAVVVTLTAILVAFAAYRAVRW